MTRSDSINQSRSPSVSNDQSNVFFIEDPEAGGLEADLAGSVIIHRVSDLIEEKDPKPKVKSPFDNRNE